MMIRISPPSPVTQKAITLWSRTTKNPNVSTGPLAHSFAHSLASITHLLVRLLACSLARLLASLTRSAALICHYHSATLELVKKRMINAEKSGCFEPKCSAHLQSSTYSLIQNPRPHIFHSLDSSARHSPCFLPSATFPSKLISMTLFPPANRAFHETVSLSHFPLFPLLLFLTFLLPRALLEYIRRCFHHHRHHHHPPWCHLLRLLLRRRRLRCRGLRGTRRWRQFLMS